MLRHGANMDAGLLSFFSAEEQTSPGAPESRFRGAETPQSNGERGLRVGGKVSPPLRPLHLQNTSISSLPSRLRPGASQRDWQRQLHGRLRVLGDVLFAFGAEEAQGSGEPLSPRPPHCNRLPNSSSRNLSSQCLQPMACSIKSSRRGQKAP